MKNRVLIFLVFLAVGALILGPLVMPRSWTPPWLRLLSETLLWFGAASLALVALAIIAFVAVIKIRGRRERKALVVSDSTRRFEPRSNIQVLPVPSSGQDGETR